MRTLLRETGATLAEVLVGLAIIAIVSFSAVQLQEGLAKLKRHLSTVSALTQFRQSVIDNIRSTDSLALSVDSNDQAIPCLKTLQNCGPSPNTILGIKVKNAAGVLLSDIATGTNGFNIRGQACQTYPSQACPFQYQTSWTYLCDPTNPPTCTTPEILLFGTLNVAANAKLGFSIDPKPYGFTIVAGQLFGSQEQLCTSAGGTYNPGPPPSCNLNTSFSCGNDKATGLPMFLQSYAPGNPPVCITVQYPTFSCPSGSVVDHIDPSGNPTCVVISPPPQCLNAFGVVDFTLNTCTPFPCSANPSACLPSIPWPGSGNGNPSDGGGGGCGAGDGSC